MQTISIHSDCTDFYSNEAKYPEVKPVELNQSIASLKKYRAPDLDRQIVGKHRNSPYRKGKK